MIVFLLSPSSDASCTYRLEKVSWRHGVYSWTKRETNYGQAYPLWKTDQHNAAQVSEKARCIRSQALQLQNYGFHTQTLSNEQIAQKAAHLSQFLGDTSSTDGAELESLAKQYPSMRLYEVPLDNDSLYSAIVETVAQLHPLLLSRLGFSSKRTICNVRQEEELYRGLHRDAMRELREKKFCLSYKRTPLTTGPSSRPVMLRPKSRRPF